MRDSFIAIGENWDTNTKGTKKDATRKLWREPLEFYEEPGQNHFP